MAAAIRTEDALSRIPEEHRIERLHGPARGEFYERFYLREQPVILEGALLGWPCAARWTLEYLNAIIGQKSHTFRYEDGKTLSMRVGDYLDLAFGPGGAGVFPEVPSRTERIPYLRHFGPLAGPLSEHYPIQSLFPRPEAISLVSYLFCGVASTKTNCHYDWSHNFVGVVRGLKHVTLLPPGTERLMNLPLEMRQKMAQGSCDYFPDPADLHLGHEPHEPGKGFLPMHHHPAFVDCPVYYAPLRPGDLVFFPAGWYHYFHNIENSLTVTTQTASR